MLVYASVKSYFALRSSVMVTEEMMASYWPESSPAKMPSQAVFLNSTATPASLATAFRKSMSYPTIFLLASTISMGGQVASVATLMLLGAAKAVRVMAANTTTSEVSVRKTFIEYLLFIG